MLCDVILKLKGQKKENNKLHAAHQSFDKLHLKLPTQTDKIIEKSLTMTELLIRHTDSS